jgi:hypothetical protein
VHQLRHVREAHVAVLELLVIEHPHTAMADDLVAVEGEVHLFDAVPLGARAEFSLCAGGSAAEQDAIGRGHRTGS